MAVSTDQSLSKEVTPTAAMVAIGDELLSGRTKDKNIAHLADFLTVKGISLREVRIVGDTSEAVIEALNALRHRHTYVFTSGGIGPTHDDITSEAVAQAFGVGIDYHVQAFAMLKSHYKARKMAFTKARQKMARIPVGAELVHNSVSVAPGFYLDNVYVMAGVPSVFNAMILSLEPQLNGGRKLLSVSLDCPLGEGTIGDDLAIIAHVHNEVTIGSYPRFEDEKFTTQIVIRSYWHSAIDKAVTDVQALFAKY